MGLGVWEIVLILVIVLIIFGAGKLPDVGNALGHGFRNFQCAINAPEDTVKDKKEDNKS